MKKVSTIISLLCILCFTASAHAEWRFGIGTGLAALKVDGNSGFNVPLAGIGPVIVDIDLSPSDIMDYMETALGFGMFATDGKWMIQASLSHLKLEDDQLTTQGGNTIASDLSFEMQGIELTVGYPLYESKSVVLRGYTGFRYISHDLEADVVVNGVTVVNRDMDENWTDALLGIAAEVPFAEKWSWDTRFDVGLGGSESAYYVNSAVSWKFATHWSTSLFGQYYAVDLENGSPGDADWYLYDADETTLGLKITYLF